MAAGHRAFVTTLPRGNDRDSYSYTCSCGRKGGSYGNRAKASEAGRRHESNPARKPATTIWDRRQ